jgi:hypothetical protein
MNQESKKDLPEHDTISTKEQETNIIELADDEIQNQITEHLEKFKSELEQDNPHLPIIKASRQDINSVDVPNLDLQKSSPINWRLLLADMTARATYSVTTGTAIELAAGMEWKEIAFSRAFALPITISTARFYGKFRDGILKKLNITKDQKSRFIAANMFTYLLFYCTQYALIRYYIIGASLQSTAIATGELFILSFPLGAAYGYWLDWFRKIFSKKDS